MDFLGNETFFLHSPLSVITNLIFTRYFINNQNYPCSLELSDKLNDYTPLLSAPMRNFPRRMLIDKKLDLNFPGAQRCQNIFVSTGDAFKTFSDMEEYVQKESEIRYNRRRYFIVLRDGDEVLEEGCAWNNAKNSDNAAMNLSKSESKCKYLKKLKFVFDVLVMRCAKLKDEKMAEYEGKKCSFYTYVIRKDTIGWKHLDDWFWANQSFAYNRNLYADRLHDDEGFYGRDFRHLKAGGADYLPYSYIDKKMGLELKAIEEFGNRFNFSVDIICEPDYWGDMFANWSGTGVMGGVITDKYDIGFSALFPLPSRIIFSDYSKPTAFSMVSCIVPAPRRVDGWLTPIKGFSFKIWMAVTGTFIGVAITFTVIKRFLLTHDKSLKYIRILSLFSLFIMQPLINLQVPNKLPLRLIYTTLLISAVLLTTVYNSRLSSLLVIPSYEGEIRTVDDLAASGVLWGEKAIDWALPLEVDDRPVYDTVYKNFRVADEHTLRTYSMRHDFAFGMERLITGFYAIGAYLQEDVITKYRAMKEDLYRQYTCLQLRKSSVLRPSIDLFLLQAWECGLLYYWENELNINHLNHRVQQSLRNPPKDDTLVKLQMHHLYGLFLIWLMGIAISSISFLSELHLFQRRRRMRKKSRIKKFKIETQTKENCLNY